MNSKKKICKTCGESTYMFTRKYGCKPCSLQNNKKTKINKVRQKIKQVSSKRARQNQAYNILRNTFLKGKVCAFKGCNKAHTEDEQLTVHHTYNRRGERLLDTRYWIPLCLDHHRFITDNPKFAEENGYVLKGRNSKTKEE